MKKSIFLLLFSVLIIGCKSAAPVTNTKVDNKSERVIKGNFALTSVTYPGSDYIKVTSFDVADSKCFVGSKWKFVSNNNTGNFALDSASCTAFTSGITWYINKEGMFVMKILNETKSKKMKQGYILKVSNLTDSSFQLVDKMDVGGQMTDIVYQFSKI
jgi:Lipocalin-like domain